MTHTYKVGDKGKTRGGDDYEVTAVGRSCILAVVNGSESSYCSDGKKAIYMCSAPNNSDLIPPKRRIQGWVNIINCHGAAMLEGPYATEEVADRERLHYPNSYKVVARVCIDIEEGEGL